MENNNQTQYKFYITQGTRKLHSVAGFSKNNEISEEDLPTTGVNLTEMYSLFTSSQETALEIFKTIGVIVTQGDEDDFNAKIAAQNSLDDDA